VKDTKVKELRDKSVEELNEMLTGERAGLYQTRRDLVFRKTTDTTSVKVRRHNIARILTVLSEKEKGSK
jgi:large subunit ribosomal protein L29